MKKRIISFILMITLTITSIGFPTKNAYAADSNQKVSKKVYIADEGGTDKDLKVQYYYEDAYFKQSAYNENKGLASMSMIACLAGGRSNRTEDWKKKPQNLKTLWTDIGFTDITFNADYTKKPTATSCAMGCASKKVTFNGTSYTLIALNINGSRLFDEWRNAVNIGTSGDFKKAREDANTAKKLLKDYIKNNGITGNVKLWLTGYAIGASKIDLLAADLDNGESLGNNTKLSKNDIYAYGFNCPAPASTKNNLNNSVYNNIKIYQYPYNLVTLIPPEKYGLGIYGDVHYLPTKNGTTNYSSKVKVLNKMLGKVEGYDRGFNLDDFMMKKASLSEPYIIDNPSNRQDLAQYLEIGIDELRVACAPSRADWVSDFQEDWGILATYMLGGLDPNWVYAIDYFMEDCYNNVFTIVFYVLFKNESSLTSLYTRYLRDAMKKAGVYNYDDAMLQRFAGVLAKVLIKVGVSYMDDGATFLGNFKIIALEALDPIHTLGWMMANDPHYTEESTDIASGSIKLSKTSYVYNGNARKPSVTLTVNGSKLVKGEDFKVSYKNNKNAGKATVTVTGINKYHGSAKKTFTIKKAEADLTAKNISKTYSSSDRSVAINMETKSNGEVKYSSSNSKIKVTSSGKIKIPAEFIGKSTITIKVLEATNYKADSTKITVNVKPTKTKITSITNPKKGEVRIKWDKKKCATAYQVQFSYYSDFSSIGFELISPSNEPCEYGANGISVGSTVYTRVRTVTKVGDKKYYSAWSAKKSITVKK